MSVQLPVGNFNFLFIPAFVLSLPQPCWSCWMWCFLASWKQFAQSTSARLWWASWNPWTTSSSPARKRFSETLHALRRSVMSSVTCSRKRWEERQMERRLHFLKQRMMKQLQKHKYFLGGSHASKSFHFSLSIQTVCQDGGGDEADEEDQQVGYLLSESQQVIWVGIIVAVTVNGLVDPCPHITQFIVDVLSVSGRVWCHAAGVCWRGNSTGSLVCPCRSLCPLPQWPAASHHEQSCESGYTSL